MKRYLVFANDNYYAEGGWQDFRGDADTKEDAIKRIERYKEKEDRSISGAWAHVVDSETKEIVHEENWQRKLAWM